jgi:sec-independent protein translocase protein TatA
MNLGPTELLIILVIVIIIFGVGRLGDVGAALGKSIREFRRASTDEEAEKAKAAAEEAKDNSNPAA